MEVMLQDFLQCLTEQSLLLNLVKAIDEASNIEDAMSVGQVKSKLWMIDTHKH